jgi:hypothetical protein
LVINLFAGQNEFTLISISFIPGSSRIESNERFIVLPLTVTTSSAENPEQFRHADGSSIFPHRKDCLRHRDSRGNRHFCQIADRREESGMKFRQ